MEIQRYPIGPIRISQEYQPSPHYRGVLLGLVDYCAQQKAQFSQFLRRPVSRLQQLSCSLGEFSSYALLPGTKGPIDDHSGERIARAAGSYFEDPKPIEKALISFYKPTWSCVINGIRRFAAIGATIFRPKETIDVLRRLSHILHQPETSRREVEG